MLSTRVRRPGSGLNSDPLNARNDAKTKNQWPEVRGQKWEFGVQSQLKRLLANAW